MFKITPVLSLPCPAGGPDDRCDGRHKHDRLFAPDQDQQTADIGDTVPGTAYGMGERRDLLSPFHRFAPVNHPADVAWKSRSG